MCDDVELYKGAGCAVSIIHNSGHEYLYIDKGWSDWIELTLTPDRARQIGLGLVKWSDAQRDGAERDKPGWWTQAAQEAAELEAEHGPS